MRQQSSSTPYQQRDLYTTLLADGRPLLLLSGLGLVLAGAFGIFLGLTYQFLPHDIAYLGLTAEQLCLMHDCRVVEFMVHDRIAFSGAVLSVGLLYLWLTEFPLQAGHGWAWWVLAASGVAGFGSFLTYLSTGYLDTWHGLATLCLLPCFTIGLWRAWRVLPASQRGLSLRGAQPLDWRSTYGRGRLLLLITALGMMGGGLTILVLGSTIVFVPQDLTFLCTTPDELARLNARLIPLIAHDRMGFGGAVATIGIVVFGIVWYSPPSRHLWQILILTSLVGFGTAIGAHPYVGYMDALHLAPPVLGAAVGAIGIACWQRSM